MNGHARVVKFLIEKRAKIGARDNAGYNALDLCIQNGHQYALI